MIVSTEAIVLKSRKYRETSKLVTLYTEQFGKCTVVANGARRAKNKFGSALEPASCSTITLYKSPNKDIHTLSAAETSLPLRALTESFELLTTAMGILELAYSSQLDEEQNPAVYGLLRHALQALNTTPPTPQLLLHAFQARLADAMGFALNPLYCPESEERVHHEQAQEFILSLADGAPFSPPLAQNRAGFRITSEALATLQLLVALPIEEIASYPLQQNTEVQLQDFFIRYLEYHLGRRMFSRTAKFLHDIKA